MEMRFVLDDKVSIVVDTIEKEAVIGYKNNDKQIRLTSTALKSLYKILEELGL